MAAERDVGSMTRGDEVEKKGLEEAFKIDREKVNYMYNHW